MFRPAPIPAVLTSDISLIQQRAEDVGRRHDVQCRQHLQRRIQDQFKRLRQSRCLQSKAELTGFLNSLSRTKVERVLNVDIGNPGPGRKPPTLECLQTVGAKLGIVRDPAQEFRGKRHCLMRELLPLVAESYHTHQGHGAAPALDFSTPTVLDDIDQAVRHINLPEIRSMEQVREFNSFFEGLEARARPLARPVLFYGCHWVALRAVLPGWRDILLRLAQSPAPGTPDRACGELLERRIYLFHNLLTDFRNSAARVGRAPCPRSDRGALTHRILDGVARRTRRLRPLVRDLVLAGEPARETLVAILDRFGLDPADFLQNHATVGMLVWKCSETREAVNRLSSCYARG